MRHQYTMPSRQCTLPAKSDDAYAWELENFLTFVPKADTVSFISGMTDRLSSRRSAVYAQTARACAGVLAVGALGLSSLITAAPANASTLIGTGWQCTVAPGVSVDLVIKAGNGGGGSGGGSGGGAGGSGGAGWDGSSTVAGGAGGAGGSSSAGGAGAKRAETYTNSTNSTVTLTFVLGVDGNGGSGGAGGGAGAAATQAGSAADGGTGESGDGGLGGNGGLDAIVYAAGATFVTVLGGDGGSGGDGGVGGQGGQGSGTDGSDGTPGSNGSSGADGAGGNMLTTNTETPFIEVDGAPCTPPASDAPPPICYQSIGLLPGTACGSGWSTSWAQWANAGRGGGVCNRYVVWNEGRWAQTPDLFAGPFVTWDGK